MKRPLGLLLTVLLLDCTSSTASTPNREGPQLLPGELCDPDNAAPLVMRFDPPRVVLAPGTKRAVRMSVDPDVCKPTKATFTSGNDGVVGAPAPATLDLRHATYDFTVAAAPNANGTVTLTASIPARMTRAGEPIDNAPVNATLDIEVRDSKPATCDKEASTQLTVDSAHLKLQGTASLASASMSVPAGAFTKQGELSLPAFPAEIGCADDLASKAPGTPLAMGPAVAFAAKAPLSMSKSLRRELDFVIPVNPAVFPPAARMRHLQVLFANPRAKAPRPIPVANPHIEKAGDGYVLKFSSPWIGTYQAAVVADAGTHRRRRKIMHRAVLGFSMGGVGSSTFGLRHHDRFDAIAPMGGPADWTWLTWYIENYPLGGFCPASQPGCNKYAPNAYPIDEVYVHSMDFNHFWYQAGDGNGGRFPRSEYLQIFQDLAIMLGNANGQNADEKLWYFPNGPKADDRWVVGDKNSGVDCRVTIDPVNDTPEKEREAQWEEQCNKFRCALDDNGRMKNGYVARSNYFDARYNPQGKYPVISFCDGGQDDKPENSPYMDTWRAPTPSEARPVTTVLAVDLNDNGVRDENEPVLQQGHEPYQDTGTDGLANAAEPGYDAENNPDPNQDDYDFQLNPSGTEGNHRHEAGEPYDDYGLDGVALTATSHIAGDVGEFDGQYTESKGLKKFYEVDAHSIIHRWSTNIPAGPLTDNALERLDVWSDGGVRDLFNFAAAANHFEGALAGRSRPDGTRLRSATFYNGFDYLPGQTIGRPQDFVPANIRWDDVPDFPSMRYGNVDADKFMITRGDGQHVGTPDQLLNRLETSFYFIAKNWTDADRALTDLARNNPETDTVNKDLGVTCEINGRCEKFFTGPNSGRTGPIAISLPPGYALEENRVRDVRYPVIYVLHGYGMDPRDLEGVAIITNNFMNSPELSYARRLPKFIIVYVDGRCRLDKSGKPECVRGTFWQDSPWGGPQMDTWFSEVMDYVDKNYRTMGPTEIDVTD